LIGAGQAGAGLWWKVEDEGKILIVDLRSTPNLAIGVSNDPNHTVQCSCA
jgi:hypothetical protein